MLELLSLYYVFPVSVTVSTITKEPHYLNCSIVCYWGGEQEPNLTLDRYPISRDAIECGGIGSGGVGYNTNKRHEIFYLIDVLRVGTSWTTVLENAVLSAMKANSGFRTSQTI